MRAYKETEYLSLREFHLAADCNNDLMTLISECVRKGYYETPGLRAHGFYMLGGSRGQGQIGKRSLNFLKLKNKSFRLETLYLGDSKRNPVSVCFYDKVSEQLRRKHAVADCESRIELRFNFQTGKDCPFTLDHACSIIASYSHPNGSLFRTRLFLNFLVQNVRFTNHFHFAGDEDYAPWWKHQVIVPLFHASLPIVNPENKAYLQGKFYFAYCCYCNLSKTRARLSKRIKG